MVKILLIIENFSELNQMSTLLEKVGCDVDSMSKEVGLSEKILSFRPEVVIVSASNQKIEHEKITSKLRAINVFSGKIILMIPVEKKVDPTKFSNGIFDGILEHPFDPRSLMNLIVQLVSGNKKGEMIEKFQKFLIQGSLGIDVAKVAKNPNIANETEDIVKTIFISNAKDHEKNLKYSKMVSNIKIGPSTITKNDANKRVKELQKGWDRKFLDEIDTEKKEVVQRLFKKVK